MIFFSVLYNIFFLYSTSLFFIFRKIFILFACIFLFSVYFYNNQFRKKYICKKIILGLFLGLLISLFYVVFTTHKTIIFINRSNIPWKCLEVTCKIILWTLFKGTVLFFLQKIIWKAFIAILKDEIFETPKL